MRYSGATSYIIPGLRTMFEIVLRIYTAYYGTTTRCLKDIYAAEMAGISVRTNLLGLIVNLAFCKMSLRSEIDKRQNINLNSSGRRRQQ
jgi:hypothetical protein